MKKLAKRIAALAMTAAMMTASAGAITQDGQSETWFDGVWALIDAFGLKAEHDPYVLQNYINKYLEKHPDEMYDVLNDIRRAFRRLRALSASVSACRRQKTAYRSLRSCAIQRRRKPVCRLAILS